MRKTVKDQLDQLQQIAQKGFLLLEDQKAYRQVVILKKLKTLNLALAPASLSNILKGKKMGYDTLYKAAFGIQQIIKAELGYYFNEDQTAFLPLDKMPPLYIIEEHDPKKIKSDVVFRSDGRLSVSEKVAFLKSAQHEIIEMGVRLNTLANHFFSRNKKEFGWPIKEILDRNVDIKLYLLHPDYNGTHFYFADRAIAQEEEATSAEQIKMVIRQLKKAYHSYALGDHPGKFEVYTYRHLPYNQFLIIDGESYNAKMLVSNYLYGIRRADCPSVECDKCNSPDLFQKYWNSFQLLAAQAKPLDLT